MAEQKQINFTIVPDEDSPEPQRIYANFCAIAHTPFDFTLTFCEVTPVKARIVAPVQFIPNLIAALQEHFRLYSEAYGPHGAAPGPPQGPVH